MLGHASTVARNTLWEVFGVGAPVEPVEPDFPFGLDRAALDHALPDPDAVLAAEVRAAASDRVAAEATTPTASADGSASTSPRGITEGSLRLRKAHPRSLSMASQRSHGISSEPSPRERRSSSTLAHFFRRSSVSEADDDAAAAASMVSIQGPKGLHSVSAHDLANIVTRKRQLSNTDASSAPSTPPSSRMLPIMAVFTVGPLPQAVNQILAEFEFDSLLCTVSSRDTVAVAVTDILKQQGRIAAVVVAGALAKDLMEEMSSTGDAAPPVIVATDSGADVSPELLEAGIADAISATDSMPLLRSRLRRHIQSSRGAARAKLLERDIQFYRTQSMARAFRVAVKDRKEGRVQTILKDTVQENEVLRRRLSLVDPEFDHSDDKFSNNVMETPLRRLQHTVMRLKTEKLGVEEVTHSLEEMLEMIQSADLYRPHVPQPFLLDDATRNWLVSNFGGDDADDYLSVSRRSSLQEHSDDEDHLDIEDDDDDDDDEYATTTGTPMPGSNRGSGRRPKGNPPAAAGSTVLNSIAAKLSAIDHTRRRSMSTGSNPLDGSDGSGTGSPRSILKTKPGPGRRQSVKLPEDGGGTSSESSRGPDNQGGVALPETPSVNEQAQHEEDLVTKLKAYEGRSRTDSSDAADKQKVVPRKSLSISPPKSSYLRSREDYDASELLDSVSEEGVSALPVAARGSRRGSTQLSPARPAPANSNSNSNSGADGDIDIDIDEALASSESGSSRQRDWSARAGSVPNLRHHLPVRASLSANSTPAMSPRYATSLGIAELDFNVWKYQSDELIAFLFTMFQTLGLIEEFNIPVGNLHRFLQEVRDSYHDNPYHNFKHAFDVAQTSYSFLVKSQVAQKLQRLDIFALLVAAVCHDINHPGLSNAFQINTHSDLAMLYNDMSVLENHHASYTFQLLRRPETNILVGLSADQQREFRKVVIAGILATDMAHHFETVTKFGNRLEMDSPASKHVKEDRQLLVNVLLHFSDICNICKPWHIHKKWQDVLLEEFLSQGDAERRLKLPVSPYCDRDNINKAHMALNFADFVVIPLCSSVVKLMPEIRAAYIGHITLNRQRWNDILDSEFQEHDETNKQRLWRSRSVVMSRSLPGVLSEAVARAAAEQAAEQAAAAEPMAPLAEVDENEADESKES